MSDRLDISTSGATRAEAIAAADAEAVRQFTVDGVLQPFQRVSVAARTKAPEEGEETMVRATASYVAVTPTGEDGAPLIETFGFRFDAGRVVDTLGDVADGVERWEPPKRGAELEVPGPGVDPVPGGRL